MLAEGKNDTRKEKTPESNSGVFYFQALQLTDDIALRPSVLNVHWRVRDRLKNRGDRQGQVLQFDHRDENAR